MPETKIGSATASDLANAFTNYSADTRQTEGAQDQKETTWTNTNWTKYFGWYKTIPECTIVANAIAQWAVGKGYEADEATIMRLDSIKGMGKDSFNSILENAIKIAEVGGDSYCEIIRDEKGRLVNLKPLDPGSIQHVANRKGKIIRYEQINKVKDGKNKKYDPQDIFHLMPNRVADEIHGTSMFEPVETIINMRNEAMADWKRVLHRNVEPLWIFHLDTDDTTEIAAFKAKMDAARSAGENMYIPKDVVVPEMVSVAANATLNPMTWIDNLNNYFFKLVGVPQIVVGGSSEFTEASAKIAYLAWQQRVEAVQLYVEEQCLNQLNIVIRLTFPARLDNEALSDNPKEEGEVTAPEIQQGERAVEPNDQQAELEGRK